MIESTEDWLKRIGSKAALEERQKLRAEGKLNAPIKGPRGLAGLVASMTNTPFTNSHRWECRCRLCWAPELMKALPHTKLPDGPVPERKKGKWKRRGNSAN